MRVVIAEAGQEYRTASQRPCKSPADAVDLCDCIGDGEQESFVVISLDRKNGALSTEIVTSGLLDASLVHPREIFRCAILRNAAAIVLAHNHPSGDPTPSAEDVRITRQLIEAGRILDIKVLDHVILGLPTEKGGKRKFISLREEGVVSFA